MAKKVASPGLQARMRRAIAMIGRGVNQSNSEMEEEGRRQLAVARTENEILLGMDHFTAEDVTTLASLLFEVATPVVPVDADDDRHAAAISRLEEKREVDMLAHEIPDDAREIAPPLNPTKEERIAAMRRGHERERAQYPQPELLEDPDDIE